MPRDIYFCNGRSTSIEQTKDGEKRSRSLTPGAFEQTEKVLEQKSEVPEYQQLQEKIVR